MPISSINPATGEVLQTFDSLNEQQLQEKITRAAEIRLLRDNVVIFEGKIASLKRFKDDASEVAKGYECGIGIQNFNDVKIGDQIEAFVTEKVMADVGA